ncbi:MAG: hypothetical protein M8867_09275 [marine benthic group bacterium]|nr:hypothetical protein [Gemmatimonadota bacterium]
MNCIRRTLRLAFVIGLLSATATPHLGAQSNDGSFTDRIYWGGGISLAFWNYTAIRIEPLVGYRITPKFSAGAKLMYEYLRYERFGGTVDSHSYGGSLFARYRFIPQLYGHLEYGGQNYERIDASGIEERVGYPFLLVGGGFVQQTGRRTSLYFELLYDVLQDEDSPYDNGGPFITVGIAVGF